MKWKVLYVDMELVLLQADCGLYVDKEKPEEHRGEANTLLWRNKNVTTGALEASI